MERAAAGDQVGGGFRSGLNRFQYWSSWLNPEFGVPEAAYRSPLQFSDTALVFPDPNAGFVCGHYLILVRSPVLLRFARI